MLAATCKWSLLNSPPRGRSTLAEPRCRFRWNMRGRPSRKIYERQNLWAIIMHSAFRRFRAARFPTIFSTSDRSAIFANRKRSSLSLIPDEAFDGRNTIRISLHTNMVPKLCTYIPIYSPLIDIQIKSDTFPFGKSSQKFTFGRSILISATNIVQFNYKIKNSVDINSSYWLENSLRYCIYV